MQFSSILLFAASAMAASVHFVNQDSTARTIYFTQNAGLSSISNLTIKGLATANQTFPTGWIGNWYSVSNGSANVPGMLGEVAFDGWGGLNYFDVSAIVNPDDNNGVKEIFPLHTNTPISGCQTFPCANAYNKWDDIQTQVSESNELVCLLGTLTESTERRRGLVSRKFVTSAEVSE